LLITTNFIVTKCYGNSYNELPAIKSGLNKIIPILLTAIAIATITPVVFLNLEGWDAIVSPSVDIRAPYNSTDIMGPEVTPPVDVPAPYDDVGVVESKVPPPVGSTGIQLENSTLRKITSQTQLFEVLHTDGNFVMHDRGVFKIEETELETQQYTAEEVGGYLSSPVRIGPSDAVDELSAPTAFSDDRTRDYSVTNIQVGGVDEPDFLKNDDRYAYIARDNTLTVVDLWPAAYAHIATKVALDIDPSYIHDIFLNGDKLVVFYESKRDNVVVPEFEFELVNPHAPAAHVVVVDITDRANPHVQTRYSVDGYFADARMIGPYVYIITTTDLDKHPWIPIVRDIDAGVDMTSETYYFEDDRDFSTFAVLAVLDLESDYNAITSETYMIGSTGTYYVTQENLYLTYNRYVEFVLTDTHIQEIVFTAIVPLLPVDVQNQIKVAHAGTDGNVSRFLDMLNKIATDHFEGLEPAMQDELIDRFEEVRKTNKWFTVPTMETVIHKISINGPDTSYVARGTVPGTLINQFSMGENPAGDRLRVATTVDYHSSLNHSSGVYVLNDELGMVGYISHIAPDESIYSARFVGDRLYMVTFRQIDPFFVIDISDDTPRILGELKIPGFSNYLHPYDADHIIGIGRDTILSGGSTEHLGVKISMFGVADVSNPKVIDNLVIGTGSTHSDVLDDHKAFFLDRTRSVISIPIEGQSSHLEIPALIVPADDWRGFYVIYVNDDKKFNLRGTITHMSSHDGQSTGYRTFYIEDVLYTVSDSMLSANDIETLEPIKSVPLQGTGSIMEFVG